MRILTFDIEEWFHILGHSSTKTEKEWGKLELRIYDNFYKLLNLLKLKNKKATFFCLGWVAKKYPEILKEINAAGYEIGTHSYMHQLIYEQNREEFKKDLEKSIKTIEDLIGRKVRAYRAPGFSLTKKSLWAFEILAEAGIEIDSSIFPAKRAHGGIRDFEIYEPFIVKINGTEIKEFPINVFKIGSLKFVFSGGGYFRLYPYWSIKRMIEKSNYVMVYLHCRDFDTGQPIIEDLPQFRKFKVYHNIRGAFHKFNRLINDFNFIDLGEAERIIDWEKAKIIDIKL